MYKLQKNNQGFTAVVLLLLIIIVILVGFAGWFVYHTDHKTSPAPVASKAATTTKTTPSTPAQPVNYFTIKEWGVRAVNKTSTTLSYSIATNNSNNAWVNSQQLAAADSNCKIVAGSGNAGYIGRYLPTDKIPTTGVASETAQAFVSQDFKASNSTPPAYAKVGSYYYIYWTGQSGCSTTASSDTVLNQTIKDITTVVDSLQTVPK